MTHATPPGWYPDASLPATERWWDGTAWTATTRPAAGAPPQFGPPSQGFGPQQSGPQQFGPPAPRRGHKRIAVLAAVGVVLAGAVAAGVVVAGRGDDHKGPETARSSSSPAATTDHKDSPTAGAPTADSPSLLVDQLDGITLPVPDGWEKPSSTVEDVTTMRTEHSYDCPGDTGTFCWHGRVTSRTATQTDLTTAEAVAKADIDDAAKSSYDRDIVGDLIYNGITSHTQLESKSVSVAGRTGYLIRWRVRTGAGPGGYVQTLAVPSSVGSEAIVVVRFAFDAGPDGPPTSLMDTITRGIRPIGDATSGGVGSSIGP
ncbi:DUF2510 domain-containing protein [Streptomyces sp. NBC_00344]|uniref:DUF2510 domain-containing protein n=1 Tax=Streptomyces sp. NBC_00344 TaxID=2975720 RepID=UPI002E232B1F